MLTIRRESPHFKTSTPIVSMADTQDGQDYRVYCKDSPDGKFILEAVRAARRVARHATRKQKSSTPPVIKLKDIDRPDNWREARYGTPKEKGNV